MMTSGQTAVNSCAIHHRMVFVYVCIECENTLLCRKCVDEEHNGHDTKSLSEYIPEQKLKITQRLKNLSSTDFLKLKGEFHNIDTQIDENGRRFETTRMDIKRQTRALKRDVDKMTGQLLKVCDEMEKKNEDIINQNRNGLSQYLHDGKTAKLARCQQVLRSGTDEEVVLLVQGRGANSIVPPPPGKQVTVNLETRKINSDSLMDLLGTLNMDGSNVFARESSCTLL